MDIDRILEHPRYNLHSSSRLAVRDDEWTRLWLDRLDPLHEIYHLIRNRRIAVRKEFYETAFVLDRLSDVLGQAACLYELGAGHGMLGVFACVLHPRLKQAILADRCRPPSYDKMLEQVALKFPYVKMRARFVEGKIEETLGIPTGSLVVGVHACGSLTDRLVESAHRAHANFVVVPCCEARKLLPPDMRRTLPRGKTAEALTELRLARWRALGYAIEERRLPAQVTARGRVFIGRLKAGKAQPRG